jgi:hypothetical protein
LDVVGNAPHPLGGARRDEGSAEAVQGQYRHTRCSHYTNYNARKSGFLQEVRLPNIKLAHFLRVGVK